MIPAQAVFEAFGKVRTAKFLVDCASLDEPRQHVREILERLAADLSTMESVVQRVAYAMRISESDLPC